MLCMQTVFADGIRSLRQLTPRPKLAAMRQMECPSIVTYSPFGESNLMLPALIRLLCGCGEDGIFLSCNFSSLISFWGTHSSCRDSQGATHTMKDTKVWLKPNSCDLTYMVSESNKTFTCNYLSNQVRASRYVHHPSWVTLLLIRHPALPYECCPCNPATRWTPIFRRRLFQSKLDLEAGPCTGLTCLGGGPTLTHPLAASP